MSTWVPEYLSTCTSLLSFRPQQNFQVLFVLTIINYDPTAQYPTACDYPTEAERVEMLVEYKSFWKVAGSSWGQLSVTRRQDRCCANVLFLLGIVMVSLTLIKPHRILTRTTPVRVSCLLRFQTCLFGVERCRKCKGLRMLEASFQSPICSRIAERILSHCSGWCPPCVSTRPLVGQSI